MNRKVTTTYLEMTSSEALKPARATHVPFSLVRSEVPCPELNRFLYVAVGARWLWHSRLSWDYARWMAYLNRPELQTRIAYVKGTPVGYFELELHVDDSVEIVYLGLLNQFIAKGIGGSLLASATKQAWVMSSRRVWVHTCCFDHPQALSNYLARGFRVYRTEEKVEVLPDDPLELWPGSNHKAG